jgi:hypothetical protein
LQASLSKRENTQGYDTIVCIVCGLRGHSAYACRRNVTSNIDGNQNNENLDHQWPTNYNYNRFQKNSNSGNNRYQKLGWKNAQNRYNQGQHGGMRFYERQAIFYCVSYEPEYQNTQSTLKKTHTVAPTNIEFNRQRGSDVRSSPRFWRQKER